MPRYRSARLPALLSLATTVGLAGQASGQSIAPGLSNVTLQVGQTVTIAQTLTLGATGASLADILLLADNTGSMAPVMSRVKAAATGLLASVPAGSSWRFGVARYGSDPCEAVADSPTVPGYSACSGAPASAATTPSYDLDFVGTPSGASGAVGAWTASGGAGESGSIYALDQAASTMPWGNAARRLVVWFGDAPGHVVTTTQAQAVAALQAEGAQVLAVNLWNPSYGSTGQAGSGIDTYGQASAITAATGGEIWNEGSQGLITASALTDMVKDALGFGSVMDLVFGTGFVGSGLSVGLQCADSRGCTSVGAYQSRRFDLSITANTAGSYVVDSYAEGVAAMSITRVTVTAPPVAVVPEPSSWALLATGLAALGFAARRRRREEGAA